MNDPSVAKAVHFIRRNMSSGSFTVADVARHVGVSRNTLALRFRAILGHSPDSEIQRAKFDLARNLLRETNFSVSLIAAQLGYSNAANFSRAFRSANGISAEEYREKTRKT